MNPMNLMQMFQNPQQFMQNIMGNNQIMSNPMAKNAVELMQKGMHRELSRWQETCAKKKV